MNLNTLSVQLYVYKDKETIFLMLNGNVLIEKSYFKIDKEKTRNEIVKKFLPLMVREAQNIYNFAKIDFPWIENKNGILEIDLSKLYRDLKVEARI